MPNLGLDPKDMEMYQTLSLPSRCSKMNGEESSSLALQFEFKLEF